ncbi:MAG: serine/threonine-protein kinase [Planctomycetaceae bacterium]
MSARTIGPFVLDRQIGIGGMGIVYSAVYPETGRTVAVKVLSPGLMADPKLVKRFEREIEILKRLNHPNIVKYYGGGTENGQRYYAMEYIDGGSLQEVLKKRTRLSWEQAIHVGRQVASALEHAHNAGIIHRDLKPANLFLTSKGRLKLGDFGIARDTEATALTAAGKTVGTYAYMAPEQIQAGPPISRKTDLYALGCVLYEVIVGQTPFQSDNPMDMLMQHLNDDPYNVCEKVPDCPAALDELIEQLLAKNPDDRPYDALAVHTRLGEIRDSVNAGSAVVSAAGVGGLPPRRKKSTTAAGPAPAPEAPVEKKKKKKNKAQKDLPFHERTWFLVTCLVALLSATVWMLLPPGEDWYPDRWRTAMRGDQYEQREALEDFIDPYLQRFPEGTYAHEAQDLSAELHANILEPQLRNLAKRNRPVDDPFKARCVAVAKLEDEAGLFYLTSWEQASEKPLPANPLPVLERWHRLIQQAPAADTQPVAVMDPPADAGDEGAADSSESGSADETAWLIQLCHNHHDYFRQRLIESPRAADFFRSRMLDAEEMLNKGETAAAQDIWNYAYQNFSEVDLFREYVEYARQRLLGRDASVPGVPVGNPPVPESPPAAASTADRP